MHALVLGVASVAGTLECTPPQCHRGCAPPSRVCPGHCPPPSETRPPVGAIHDADRILETDQLLNEMTHRGLMDGFLEMPIKFPPTYVTARARARHGMTVSLFSVIIIKFNKEKGGK